MRALWVDAACIDQTDVQERNHQVGQMQNIYADAEEVVVWLGPASSDSSLAIRFIKQLCACLDDITHSRGGDKQSSGYIVEDLDEVMESFSDQSFSDSWSAVARLF